MLKLAPAKTLQITEPSRREWVAQTRGQLLRHGFSTAGSTNLDRQLGIGYHPLTPRNMPLTTDHPGDCQYCGCVITEQFVDGVGKHARSWATMCVACHSQHGMGFGDGLGQLYRLDDGVFTRAKQ